MIGIFRHWRAKFQFSISADIPHLVANLKVPCIFVVVKWYYHSGPFKAWPEKYETSLTIGWRWPWKRYFREKKWGKLHSMPVALYWTMDETYLAMVVNDLAETVGRSDALDLRLHIGPTIRHLKTLDSWRKHNYWIASCPNCARAALVELIKMRAKYEKDEIPNPHEDPIIGFRRREKAAQARLKG